MKVPAFTEVDVASQEALDATNARLAALEARVSELEYTPIIPDTPPVTLGVNTIFFDDFNAPEDGAWTAIPTAVVDWDRKPSRWDYYRCVNSNQYFEPGAGRNGDSAYVIELNYPREQMEIGSLGVQFPETLHVHLRMWVKLSEGFQYGSPSWSGGLWWKWYRLHQSPWTRGRVPPQGTNGEDNTNFIVGTTTGAYFDHACCWRTQEKGSSSGPYCVYKNKPENVDVNNPFLINFGEYDHETWQFWNCKWTQIDITHRLGDIDEDNGDLIIWVDGVKMAPPFNTLIPKYGGRKPVNDSKLCTNPRAHYGNPPGWNSFSFFDNLKNMTLTWDKQHKFYCDAIYLFDGIPNDLDQ